MAKPFASNLIDSNVREFDDAYKAFVESHGSYELRGALDLLGPFLVPPSRKTTGAIENVREGIVHPWRNELNCVLHEVGDVRSVLTAASSEGPMGEHVRLRHGLLG